MSIFDMPGAGIGITKALQEIAGGTGGLAAGSMAVAGVSGGVNAAKADSRQDKALALHQRHIHALWSHLERLEKVLTINRSGELKLEMGSASITMRKNGDVLINGKDITIKSSGRFEAKASGDVIIKGSKISQN